jgi:RNA polymerase sigma-70 factor (ECF subfamily)
MTNPLTDNTMQAAEAAWREHGQRVFDIAYRMTGSIAEAEDIAQETSIRLLASDLETIDDVLGWLVTVSSRLSVDRLRLHENSRRAYVGPWLPEPLVSAFDDDTANRVTLDDTVRMALLVVLDQMSPAERTAFVLHDVFDLPFVEIAEIVGRSPQAVRQLATRARRRIREDQTIPGIPADRDQHRELVAKFAEACSAGDLEGLISLLAADVVGDFDSGGFIPQAPLTELDGAEPVARQLIATMSGIGASFEPTEVNGSPGVLVSFGDVVAAVISVGVRDGTIDLIYGIGNPAKLAHLQPEHPLNLLS